MEWTSNCILMLKVSVVSGQKRQHFCDFQFTSIYILIIHIFSNDKTCRMKNLKDHLVPKAIPELNRVDIIPSDAIYLF